MEKLTPADIKILEKSAANGKKFQRILMGFAFVLIVLLALSLFSRWQFPAPFILGAFSAFLVVISIIQYFMYRKVALDLEKGVSTTLEGVIAKMEMKQGPNSYNTGYTKELLRELAKDIEDKEKGVGKDYGVEEWNLSKAASSAFNIILKDGSIHTISLRDYIDLNVHDKVRITLTPLSKTFLRLIKL